MPPIIGMTTGDKPYPEWLRDGPDETRQPVRAQARQGANSRGGRLRLRRKMRRDTGIFRKLAARRVFLFE